MYWYSAMWRAFQTADAVSVGEICSATRPMPVRWLLTRLTTALARSGRLTGHDASGVQVPTTARAGGVATAVASVARIAAARTAPPASRAVRRDIKRNPSSVGCGETPATVTQFSPGCRRRYFAFR